jgi:hypothetical protein
MYAFSVDTKISLPYTSFSKIELLSKVQTREPYPIFNAEEGSFSSDMRKYISYYTINYLQSRSGGISVTFHKLRGINAYPPLVD